MHRNLLADLGQLFFFDMQRSNQHVSVCHVPVWPAGENHISTSCGDDLTKCWSCVERTVLKTAVTLDYFRKTWMALLTVLCPAVALRCWHLLLEEVCLCPLDAIY